MVKQWMKMMDQTIYKVQNNCIKFNKCIKEGMKIIMKKMCKEEVLGQEINNKAMVINTVRNIKATKINKKKEMKKKVNNKKNFIVSFK